jgi:GMP synthase (glutamine-hydrolysing) A subunit
MSESGFGDFEFERKFLVRDLPAVTASDPTPALIVQAYLFHPWDMDAAALRAFAPKGIILSGGPESVTEAGSPRAADVVWSLGVPVLGICYGMQTMAVQLGGAVQPGEVKEFGYAEIRAHGHSRLLDGIEDRVNAAGHGLLDVWMSHGDRVSALPAGFKRIASTADVPLAGMADEARGYYAFQFHPEVTHTPQGKRIYAASCTTSAAAAAPGPPATSSMTPSPRAPAGG